jgi:hypothetical protein
MQNKEYSKINKDCWVEISFLAGIFLKSGLRPSMEEATLLTNCEHKVLLMPEGIVVIIISINISHPPINSGCIIHATLL